MKKATLVRRNICAGLFLLLLLPFTLPAAKFVVEPGLEISFRLFDQNVAMKEYTMIIFRNGIKEDSFMVKKDREVYLLLDLNCSYSVSIKKPHYKERLILADTKVPSGKENGEYNYSFDLTMLSDTMKSAGINDIPVLEISYDAGPGAFISSQPEGITVVSDSDVITDSPAPLPKNDCQSPSPARKKGLRMMVLRKK